MLSPGNDLKFLSTQGIVAGENMPLLLEAL